MSENPELSERELEILRLVATGASNKEIASQLVISANTVKVHLRNIFSKLEVSSRTEATIAAVRMGIIQPKVDRTVDEPGDGESDTNTKGNPYGRVRWWVPIFIIVFILIAIAVIMVFRIQQPNSTLNPDDAQLQAESRWQEHMKMPNPRKGFAGAVYDDQIFIIGGETEDGVTNLVERYNPDDDSWDLLASKITPVTDIRAAAIGGLIYVPGGRLETGEVIDKLEVYDPVEDRWDSHSSIPEPLSAYALAAFEGKLYIFGGWNGDEYVDHVYAYNPSDDRWEEKASMPTARGYAGVGIASGKIYILGGTNGEILSDNEAYQPSLDDAAGNPWEVMSPLPKRQYAMGSTSVAEIIHVIGGDNPIHENLAWKYFPQNDQWEEFSGPTEKIWMHLNVLPLGTRIYAMGGQIAGELSDQNTSYQAIFTITIPVIR